MLRLDMDNAKRSASAANTYHNRVGAILLHLTRYNAGAKTSRFAADAGVGKATISKLIHGKTNSLYTTALKVVKCLEQVSGRRLLFDDVFSIDGRYRTPFVCTLMKCPRCLPPWLFDPTGLQRLYGLNARAGQWTGDATEFDNAMNKSKGTSRT